MVWSNFYDRRKPARKCPLSALYSAHVAYFCDSVTLIYACIIIIIIIRTKIKNKHLLCKQYLLTRNVEFLRKYKRLRNQIRKITRSIHRAEQNEVARSAKTNPKKFWAYVKHKTSLKTIIGDVKTCVDGKEAILSNDEDKASAITFPVSLP